MVTFFSVMASLCVIFFYTGVSPFGSKSVLMSDLSAQYAPYLSIFRDKILHHGNLTYSFQIGMGKNFMGILAYYLSSPLNLLTVFFPESKLSEAILLLIMLKLSFAGCFTTWFLDRKFAVPAGSTGRSGAASGTDGKGIGRISILFGLIYALSSFSMSFIFNFIWLDGFALLPLLLLCVDDFRKGFNVKNGCKLLAVLVLLFLSGYYMAYMVGIFSFFYLLASIEYSKNVAEKECAENEKNASFGSALSSDARPVPAGKTVGFFVLLAVCAALICAVLLLPAGLDTIRNGDRTSSFSTSLAPEFSLLKFLPQLFLGKLTNVSTNMPFVFSSLLVLLLSILFFLNSSIARSLKIRAGLYLILGVLSFMLPPLNMAWQLFDDPNWFLYRYSFLFIFGSILLAYYSFLKLKALTNRDFCITGAVFLILLILSDTIGKEEGTGSMFFQNLVVGALLTVCLWGLTKEKWVASLADLRRWGAGLLVPIVLVEIVFLGPKVTVGAIWDDTEYAASFSSSIRGVMDVSDPVSRNSHVRPVNDITTGYPDGRTEAVGQLGENIDSLSFSAYTGTAGMSAFCSMSNKELHRFLKQLGYCTNFNYFSVEHRNMNLVPDSILGLRYFVAREDQGAIAGLTEFQRKDDYILYENPYAMDMAFVAEPDAVLFDGYALEKATTEKDLFAFQEAWLASLSNWRAEHVYYEFFPEWEVVNAQELTVVSDELAKEYGLGPELLREDGTLITASSADGQEAAPGGFHMYLRSTKEMPIILKAEVTVPKDGPLYLAIPFLDRSDPISVYCNGVQIYKEESTSYFSVIVDTGVHERGETIYLEIRCNDDSFASYTPELGQCDLEELAKQKEFLRKCLLAVIADDGSVSFVADTATPRRLIVTTIPYEEGWSLKIDGEPAEIIPYQGAFISFMIETGTYGARLQFTPPGMALGRTLSIAGLCLSAAVLILIRISARKQTRA